MSVVLTACVSQDNVGDVSSKALSQRSDADRARDVYRHPVATLDFFGLQPGMTVVEVLPGGGWYTPWLVDRIGSDGVLHAANYADRMWPLFGMLSEEAIAKRKRTMLEFGGKVAALGGDASKTQGFSFESVPPQLLGTVDLVFMARALHNLNRFEGSAQTRTRALQDIRALLKPDGRVGVVQHRAPESNSDEWAVGSAGYLKQSAVIAMFLENGFELVASSEINANKNDQPSEQDSVWRLLPSLRGVEKDSAEAQKLRAIGESDRMTLLFRKK